MRPDHGFLNCRVLTLGSVNLTLVSLYFIPAWGRDAVRVLISPYHGLEQRVHGPAVLYLRDLFDLSFSALAMTSNALAGIKLVIVAAFTAYLIEFARAWLMGRKAERETTDVVLILAAVGVALCPLPAALGDPALLRLCAAQTSLVAGAIVVIAVERRLSSRVVAEAATAPVLAPQAQPQAQLSEITIAR